MNLLSGAPEMRLTLDFDPKTVKRGCYLVRALDTPRRVGLWSLECTLRLYLSKNSIQTILWLSCWLAGWTEASHEQRTNRDA